MPVKPVRVVKNIISPIEDFLKTESSSGVILLLTTMVALIWANSGFHESYESFIEMPMGFTIGKLVMQKTLHHWVNDGLMVIFFFVVGLEIKRELVLGELSTPKKAALPMFAALGGMVVPALIYKYFNFGLPSHSGWGIPMATDIAFAVGVLMLMGNRVPFAMKIFLLALAIVDDLGAVLVIAFFYTSDISTNALGLAAVVFIVTYVFRVAGVRSLMTYVILGIFAWLFVLKSGVHATIAGVILGLMTPLEATIPRMNISEKLKGIMDELMEELKIKGEDDVESRLPHSAEIKLHAMKESSIESISPLDRLIHTLHPWVSFAIMPLFALVNAGVRVEGISFEAVLSSPVAIGVFLGLLVGKPLGVVLFSLIAVKTDLARLPRNVTWTQMTGVGFLAGIGFTMALFIGHLALPPGDNMESFSKIGILLASLFAGIAGSGLLSLTPKKA